MVKGAVTSPPHGGMLASIDYYSIVAATVAELPESTAESRHFVYDLARQVLQARLEAASPQISKRLIKIEQLAFYLAIRKAEVHERARDRAAERSTPAARLSSAAGVIGFLPSRFSRQVAGTATAAEPMFAVP